MRNAERLLQKFRSKSDIDNYSPQVQKLLAEWEQDYAMAKERSVTGREPECRPLEIKESGKGRKAPHKQIRAMDIP